VHHSLRFFEHLMVEKSKSFKSYWLNSRCLWRFFIFEMAKALAITSLNFG